MVHASLSVMQWICFVLGWFFLIVSARSLFMPKARRRLIRSKYLIKRRLFEPYAILILLFIGCCITLAPMTWDTIVDPEITEGHEPFIVQQIIDCALATFYNGVQALVLQNDLPSYFNDLYNGLAGGADLFSIFYNILITFYLVTLPTMLAFVAIDAFANGLKEALLWVNLLRSHTIYAFNASCKNATSLATDIVEHLKKKVEKNKGEHAEIPLLLFSTTDAEDEAESARVKDIAEGYARVRFTKVPFEEIPTAVFKKFRKLRFHVKRNYDGWELKDRVLHLIAISDDCDRNVRDVIQATDQVVKNIEIQALKKYGNKADALVTDGKPINAISDITKQLEKHLHLVCLHSNPDDSLVFDSLPQRGPKDEVKELVGLDNPGLSDKEYKRIFNDLRAVECNIRSNMEVRLLSGPRQEIFQALTEHPLFDVLDQANLCDPDQIKHQLLVVVIAGLGDRGIQALRSAYWFGRLPGVELRIIGVDVKADERAESLAGKYPAMMAERIPNGWPSVYPEGAGIGKQYLPDLTPSERGLDAPAVRLCKMDATSHDFNALMTSTRS